jgi:hypothetical protein
MARQSIDVGSAANDGTGDSIRGAFQKCNSNFEGLSASFNISSPVSKYVQPWSQSIGGVAVANGSTHTVTHNLSSDDILVEVWVNESDSNTNAEKLDSTMNAVTGLTYGAFITGIPSVNTCVLQLGDTGYPAVNSSGTAVGSVFTSSWIKVIVIG